MSLMKWKQTHERSYKLCLFSQLMFSVKEIVFKVSTNYGGTYCATITRIQHNTHITQCYLHHVITHLSLSDMDILLS